MSLVTGVVVCPDGVTLVSVGRDKIINVWDIKEGKSKKTIPVFESIEAVVLIPNNASFAIETKDNSTLIATAGEKVVNFCGIHLGVCETTNNVTSSIEKRKDSRDLPVLSSSMDIDKNELVTEVDGVKSPSVVEERIDSSCIVDNETDPPHVTTDDITDGVTLAAADSTTPEVVDTHCEN